MPRAQDRDTLPALLTTGPATAPWRAKEQFGQICSALAVPIGAGLFIAPHTR